MKTLEFTLKGLSPILMHNPAGMVRGDANMKRKEIPTPEDEAEKSLYKLQNGDLCVPATAVRNAMLNGSKGYRIGKRNASAILSGAVLLIDEYFPLFRDNKPIRNYEIDVRRAVVQKQGIMRARPRVDLEWELRGVFLFNEELASVEHMETALKSAGQVVGLLDFRVEKKGWFGRFEVKNIKLVNL